MKTVFSAPILQAYRHKNDKWYDKVKGHTGVDLGFYYEPFFSPFTGTILQVRVQPEMGLCLYLVDAWNNVHVWAHFSRLYCATGQKLKRGDTAGVTGGQKGGKPGIPGDKQNAGSITSGPHTHWETIIRGKPYHPGDAVMFRNLMGVKGYNTDPLAYARDMYGHFGVPAV